MNPSVSKRAHRISWVAQIAASAIIGQALFFKFAGAPEAVSMFRELGIEPWGRLLIGSLELIAVAMLWTPRLTGVGGALTAALMVGAIGAHLTKLGIAVNGDGGALFMMALAALATGSLVAWIHRRDLPGIGTRLTTPRLADETTVAPAASR